MQKKKVWIPNRSFHDFSDAERFGELHYLTEGEVRGSPNLLARRIHERLTNASEDDYLLISSLSILNVLAAAFLSRRFGRLNLLLFDKMRNRYIPNILQLSNGDLDAPI
jgi:hypothetical protein